MNLCDPFAKVRPAELDFRKAGRSYSSGLSVLLIKGLRQKHQVATGTVIL